MARPQHPSRKRAAAREGGRDIGVDDDELMAACREDGVYQIRAEGVDDPIAATSAASEPAQQTAKSLHRDAHVRGAVQADDWIPS